MFVGTSPAVELFSSASVPVRPFMYPKDSVVIPRVPWLFDMSPSLEGVMNLGFMELSVLGRFVSTSDAVFPGGMYTCGS